MAEATPDGTEDAVLTWAEGPGEAGTRVRMFAGEIDGRGVVYAEYFSDRTLQMTVAYERVFIDNDSVSSIRRLRNLEMVGQTADGFAFTADEGTVQLRCTALQWADATINCTRGVFAPKGSASCAKYFKSNVERFQCNGLQEHFSTPAIPHEELLALCAPAFRDEPHRTGCLRYGYNARREADAETNGWSVALFRETLAACIAAYRTDDERDYCMFYSFAPANPKDRPSIEHVRSCDRENDDDKATSDCVFLKHTGVKQVHPKPRTTEPTERPTAPLAANVTPAKPRLSGGRIDVATGTWRDLSIRATGGMVETEPVLWVDGYRNETHEWMTPVDRIVVGKQVRALREVSALDRVKLSGSLLTFRAVLAGKSLSCRVDAPSMFARCR